MSKMLISVYIFFLTTVFLSVASALRVVDSQVILEKFEDYQFCQTKDYTGDWCHDALKRWVEQNPSDAFKAGKATRKVMNAYNAIPFFLKSFKAQAADCKDQDVSLAVASALDLPNNETYKDLISGAQEIGLKICLSEMKNKIFSEASIGSNRLENICKISTAAKLLPPLKQSKCKS